MLTHKPEPEPQPGHLGAPRCRASAFAAQSVAIDKVACSPGGAAGTKKDGAYKMAAPRLALGMTLNTTGIVAAVILCIVSET